MDVLLLQNPSGSIGIAMYNETRRVESVTYDSLEKALYINFKDSEAAVLAHEIDNAFNKSLHSRKNIFIGHYSAASQNGEPDSEYPVPLRL